VRRQHRAVVIDHPLLDKVSFTGSGGAGFKMLEASSKLLRPTSLELGGKSAFVVFDDAEEYLDAVVDWVMVGIFACTGQVCSATSRLLVHKNIEQALMERLVARTAKIQVGDPLLEGTNMGPVVSEGQQKKILQSLQTAAAEGCTLHSAPLNLSANLDGGFYVPPTVLSNVPVDSSAWRDEIFGPVLAVRSFETEEEAIQLANDTPYGLGNAVYSKDAARCARVSLQLKSGVVWENCSNVLFENTPFGGRVGKASGFGHEYGVPGLLEYVSPKTVVRATTPGYQWGAYSS
jgi:betaine-aldehyde dehydrogenase